MYTPEEIKNQWYKMIDNHLETDCCMMHDKLKIWEKNSETQSCNEHMEKYP
jgi:hypothetical protein